MQWSDDAIVLGCRRHGESSTILEVFARNHGRVLGLVRGGRSRRMQPTLQPGNRLAVTWRARLEDQLGQFIVEPLEMRAARLMESPSGVNGIQLIAAHLRLLPEREALAGVYDAVNAVIGYLPQSLDAGELIVRFELALLEELGFGLDLKRCALTGAEDGLAFVSPKTGRAVTREAGAPWAGQLIALPSFLRVGSNARPDAQALAEAFALTGHFLARHVYEPRAISVPAVRDSFVRFLTRAVPEADVEPALP
jgi:DNA repair protein RecO (recombination protein O)